MNQHTQGDWMVEHNMTIPENFQVAAYSQDGNRSLQIIVRSHNQVADMKLVSAAPKLAKALHDLYADYKRMADCGDCGHWTADEQPEGKQAIEALKLAGYTVPNHDPEQEMLDAMDALLNGRRKGEDLDPEALKRAHTAFNAFVEGRGK